MKLVLIPEQYVQIRLKAQTFPLKLHYGALFWNRWQNMGFCTLQGPQRLSGGSNKLSFLHRLGCEFYKIVVLEPLNKISKSINFNSGPTVHYQPHTRNYSQFPCTTHLLKTTSISCSYTPLTSTTHLKSDNYLQLLNSTLHYIANDTTTHH